MVASLAAFDLSKRLIHQLLQGPLLGGFGGVGLDEVVGFGFQDLVKAQDVIIGDQVYDSRRRHAVDLVLLNVADSQAKAEEAALRRQEQPPSSPAEEQRQENTNWDEPEWKERDALTFEW